MAAPNGNLPKTGVRGAAIALAAAPVFSWEAVFFDKVK
jgi:hypothetical protein